MPDGSKRELDGEERARLLKGCGGLVRALFERRKCELRPDFQNVYSAEDFWSEVQAKAWRDSFQVRGDPAQVEAAFRGYVLRIAAHRLTELRRYCHAVKRPPIQELDPSDGLAQVAGHDNSPSRGARRGERKERLHAAIARLPDPAREVVVMRYFEVLSIPEIARCLNLTAGAVEKRLDRALARLHRELGGHASDYLSG